MMEWEPTEREDVLNEACPPTLRFSVPNVVVSSLKVTVPVGVPPVFVTVAVKVTD
jgi:hypothetical protein